jgi:hypothetical protein
MFIIHEGIIAEFKTEYNNMSQANILPDISENRSPSLPESLNK